MRLCIRIAREIHKSINEVLLLPQSEILMWAEVFYEEWEEEHPEEARKLEYERRVNEGVTQIEAESDIAKFKAIMRM